MKKVKSDLCVNYKIDPLLKLTSYSGYKIFRQAEQTFSALCGSDIDFGMKERNRTFTETDYFNALTANLVTGGTVISDVKRFENDKVFQQIFGFQSGIPQSSAIGKFLGKAHSGAIEKFRTVNRKTLHNILSRVYKGRKPVVRVLCFMDSTELEVYGKQFEGASKNYNGDQALRIHAIFLEDFLVSLHLYSPEGKFVTFGWADLLDDLKYIQDIVNTEIHIMMDSAYYDYEIIKRIEQEGWKYSVTLKQFSVFSEESQTIPEDRWINDYSSFEYLPSNRESFYRVAVKRVERERDLFGKYDYYCIITNNRKLSSEQIFYRHSTKMGMENRFKDLLIDFNLHHPRMQSLSANRLYCQVVMLAYNLIKAIQYLKLQGHDFFLSIRSFILKFIVIPGKLVKHSGKRTLKLPYFPGGESLLNSLTC